MSSALDSLNLRPQEKRVIVAIAVVVFVILNLVLVFPHFKDYAKIEAELKKTRQTIATNNAIIAKDKDPVHGLKKQLEDPEQQQGGVAAFKEIALLETVTAQARANGFFPQTSAPVKTPVGPASQSDKFFESQSVRIVVQSAEDALVKFIYDVGNDPAMIRVWELELHPFDNNRYRLNAAITLTANYQKTAAPSSAPAEKAVTKTPAQPSTSPAPKAGARSGPATNTNPAPPRRGLPPPVQPGPGRSMTPPSTNPPSPNSPSMIPPAPGRAVTPPVVVPTRTPRTAVGG